jgi:kexin
MILFLVLVSFAIARNVWTASNVTNATELAATYGLRHVAHVLGYDVFDAPVSRNTIPIAGMMHESKKSQYKRFFTRTADPLYPMQWNLIKVENGTNAYTGRGVVIGIVDDGVQYSHPDLEANFAADLSYDYNHNQNNVNPYNSDGHGTSAAGVCCAVANNVCGVGVAHNAKIAGIRLISEATYDYVEALAILHKKDRIRIKSCSWGPQDDGNIMEGPGRVMERALWEESVIVWASGNGRQFLDDSNFDGYANHPNVIAIGAIDKNGNRAYYSEGGACLFAVTPSSGAGVGVITSDLMGDFGYSPGMCTNAFGGTSAAAPLAAGIFALMLEVRPELKTRDIQEIVAKLANYTHSHEFGFGLLTIPPLLAAAKTHTLVGTRLKFTTGPFMVGKRIPEDGSWETQDVIIPSNEVRFIERVVVTVSITHACRGQLLIEFDDSKLATFRHDAHSGHFVWSFSTVHMWGKGAGTYKLRIRDSVRDNKQGTVETIAIDVYHR